MLPKSQTAAYSSRKAPKVEIHHCTFIPDAEPCHTATFNNAVIVLGGGKKESQIPWSCSKIPLHVMTISRFSWDHNFYEVLCQQ